ncbi:hypothetical protein BJ322DRAFT_1217046 [Thelephora terrestris]|uniref:Uncharacterized protein n=1 Tax=Thelephora terrestris TaxID=56493 RepID=A0A9P6HMA6_9AGAM|nr:hypothetical protein BJ322DRAFT_1217046 [Thelephora terrestris]
MFFAMRRQADPVVSILEVVKQQIESRTPFFGNPTTDNLDELPDIFGLREIIRKPKKRSQESRLVDLSRGYLAEEPPRPGQTQISHPPDGRTVTVQAAIEETTKWLGASVVNSWAQCMGGMDASSQAVEDGMTGAFQSHGVRARQDILRGRDPCTLGPKRRRVKSRADFVGTFRQGDPKRFEDDELKRGTTIKGQAREEVEEMGKQEKWCVMCKREPRVEGRNETKG